MKTRQSSAAPPQMPPSKPLPQTLADLRTSAFLHGVGAVGILAGAGWLAQETGIVDVAWLGLAATVPALRAVVIWRATDRLTEHLPPRPVKDRKPSHWLRIWWWLRSRPPRVKPAPEPFRRVRVGDDDEVLMPRQPGEMRNEKEKPVVREYTASDLYEIACRAWTYGLSERAVDDTGHPVWQFGDGQRLVLPSGAQLSRDGFRAVQAWLVQHGYATAKPSYALLDTPEAVLEAL